VPPNTEPRRVVPTDRGWTGHVLTDLVIFSIVLALARA
jgi:hypothetical protein